MVSLAEIAQQLPSKKRTVADLVRFVSTRTDNNPNYTLLLGAGCSISSGVRSANHLVSEWRAEIYIAQGGSVSDGKLPSVDEQRGFLQQRCGEWYDPNREYSSLFERKFDLQRQRRMFVEKEVAGKTPSIGYAYLTALVTQNYFNTAFTTNFDDLLNEAFYSYSAQRPIVCAHDSSINSVTVTSKRPKIIKLHGDYLFDDLKATTRETESLEQNMRAKFVEFAKDYGLIVVGYGGGDRSLMDVISSLLKNDDYFRSGIYWCIRKDGEVSEELRKLLWRERVYFVEIDGFDELFADLYSKLNGDESFPAEALSVTRDSNKLVADLVSSETRFPRTNDVLKRAYERISRQSKRKAIANLLTRPEDQSPVFGDGNFTDDELLVLTEIQALISSGSYQKAVDAARAHLNTEIRKSMRRRIYRMLVPAHQSLGQQDSAIHVANDLIEMQRKNASNYVIKSRVFECFSERLAVLDEAVNNDPYSVRARLERAQVCIRNAERVYGEDRARLLAKAEEDLVSGCRFDPASSNPCWSEHFSLVKDHFVGKSEERSAKLDSIIDKLREQNPFGRRVLSLRAQRLEDTESPSDGAALLEDIREAKERYWTGDDFEYDALRLQVLDQLDQLGEIQNLIDDLTREGALTRDVNLVYVVAQLLRRRFAEDEKAFGILRDALQNFEFDADVWNALVYGLAEMGRADEAQEILEKGRGRVRDRAWHQARVAVLDAAGKLDEAIRAIGKLKSITGVEGLDTESYILLRKGDFVAAEKSARAILNRCNYSVQAEVEIVNLAYARKAQGAKIDEDRLNNLLAATKTPSVRVAALAILGSRRHELGEAVRKCMQRDKTFRFEVRRWPLFQEYLLDPSISRLIEVAPEAPRGIAHA